METEAPEGIGLYLRRVRLDRFGRLIERLVKNEISWAAIGGPWHDFKGERWINHPNVARQAAVLLSAAGIAPHLWGYPWHDRVRLFIEHMERCTVPEIVGWLLDPELGLKGHPWEAAELFAGARESNPYRLLGLTSYGLPRYHRTFPFASFARHGERGDLMVECDYGSPQLYDIPEYLIHQGISDYHKLGFDHVVPSFGLYKHVPLDSTQPMSDSNRKAVSKTRVELCDHLGFFFSSSVEVKAAIGWAENFIIEEHWEVLRYRARCLKDPAVC